MKGIINKPQFDVDSILVGTPVILYQIKPNGKLGQYFKYSYGQVLQVTPLKLSISCVTPKETVVTQDVSIEDVTKGICTVLFLTDLPAEILYKQKIVEYVEEDVE